MVAIILTLMLQANASDDLATRTGYTEEEITKILMECNNRFLQGETLFMGNSKDKDRTIRKYYPRDTEVVFEHEKAARLLEFSKCQEISAAIKILEKSK